MWDAALDPLRIVVRVAFAYVVLLALVRLSGERTVKQGSPFDFTVALILGDLIDDVVSAAGGDGSGAPDRIRDCGVE